MRIILFSSFMFLMPAIAAACPDNGADKATHVSSPCKAKTESSGDGMPSTQPTVSCSKSPGASAMPGRTASIRDDQGRIKIKTRADGSTEEFIYHPQTGKLILVLGKDKRIAYHYDRCGRLIHAESSDGQEVSLTYGVRGLIRTMAEGSATAATRRILHFQYNAMEKPVVIELVGVGSITVEYDDKGEIVKVNAKEGSRMALQITGAFQTLLTLVRDADVRL